MEGLSWQMTITKVVLVREKKSGGARSVTSSLCQSFLPGNFAAFRPLEPPVPARISHLSGWLENLLACHEYLWARRFAAKVSRGSIASRWSVYFLRRLGWLVTPPLRECLLAV